MLFRDFRKLLDLKSLLCSSVFVVLASSLSYPLELSSLPSSVDSSPDASTVNLGASMTFAPARTRSSGKESNEFFRCLPKIFMVTFPLKREADSSPESDFVYHAP